MTGIIVGSGSSLPAEIDGLAKLLIWTTIKLQELQPTYQYLLSDQEPPTRISQWRIQSHKDYGQRFSLFWVLPLPSDWASQANKFWQKLEALPSDTVNPLTASETFTPGTGGSLPSSVNKICKLAAWCADLTDSVVGNLQVKEFDELVIQGQVVSGGFIYAKYFSTGEDVNSQKLMTFRASVPMESTLTGTATELWQQGREFNNVAIPERFLNN